MMLMCMCLSASAQRAKAFSQLFETYSGVDGCESVMMGPAMFKMMEDKARESGKDVSGYAVLHGIDVIYILNVSNEVDGFDDDLQRTLSYITGLEVVNSKSDNAGFDKVYMKRGTHRDKDNTFIQVRDTGEKTSVIYIHGDFSLKSISSIPSIVK